MKIRFKTILNILVKHHPKILIFGFFLSLISAGLIYYFCIWSAINLELELPKEKIKIEREHLQLIFENLQKREQNFSESLTKIYPDPFFK